ncbi:MAG: hypothetical protein JHC26_01380 [Thermofilum sp.]|jgi:hypothetical protein|uniref:hypothetical protein n=1 Tax=Thermofilum sp. TaxID=1961369 RepID=UPI0025903901|nr:hypothetical protein [Thermofilum sp.]MCI4407712.1 hypothetical protein [Thermofilum sp.]
MQASTGKLQASITPIAPRNFIEMVWYSTALAKLQGTVDSITADENLLEVSLREIRSMMTSNQVYKQIFENMINKALQSNFLGTQLPIFKSVNGMYLEDLVKYLKENPRVAELLSRQTHWVSKQEVEILLRRLATRILLDACYMFFRELGIINTGSTGWRGHE